MQRLAHAYWPELELRPVSISAPLRLRPLEIGDVLDETFRMYRRHFLLFAGVSVILAIPSAALIGLFLGWLALVVQQSSGSTVNNPFDATSVVGLLGILALALVVNVLILPFSHAAVTYAACESALGRPVTAGGVFRGVLRRYFPLLAPPSRPPKR